ncbi:hypothetical protein DEJ37_12585 [Kocuria rosea]|nr:hypothetical protein DEJ37_12585 [Kocuria rosea]STX04076.1 Uncharacterised protein [Kocuria rosea]
MSVGPTSRTVRDMAKKLAQHTNAGQLKRIRAVQRIVHLTRTPLARAVLALRELEAEGFHVRREDLARTFPRTSGSPGAPSAYEAAEPEGVLPPSDENGGRVEELQGYEMPTSFLEPWNGSSSSSPAEEFFDSRRWWRTGRSLGVYGEDRDSRGLFVLEMMHQLLEEGIPTIIPIRELIRADQEIFLPAAEVVDLRELPEGIGGFMNQLTQRARAGGEAVLLLDPRHGLEEEDHAGLAQWVAQTGSRIRLVYTESYAVRGWTSLMDAMLTYAETVFLSPAKSVDLQTVGVADSYPVPAAPGAGIYCTEEGHVLPFEAPPGRSTSLLAHQANIVFGACGDRPGPGGGFAVPMQQGDVLRFWSDQETDESWTLIAYSLDYGVIRQGVGGAARYQVYSYIRGLRGAHPELERGEVDQDRAQELIKKLRFGHLNFPGDAIRLDLNSIERDGEFLLHHQVNDEG